MGYVEFIVLTATGLFAGAALYVSAVEHPARMSLAPQHALAEFRPSYRRGAVMQILLSAIGGLGGLGVGIATGFSSWTVGGGLLLSAIPYTLIAMLKTNHRLTDSATPLRDDEATRLLRRWGQRHITRTALGAAGFVVMLRGVVPQL